MIAETFLDTNVLLYAAAGRVSAPAKHEIAQGLLTTPFGTSGQVLAEFFVNATRKGPKPLALDEAGAWVRLLTRKPLQPVDAGVVLAAINLSAEQRISYWNAAILAAAAKLGARTVFSEDLSHGQAYGPVTVVNPFLDA